MTSPKEGERVPGLPQEPNGTSRRSFLQKASLAGVGVVGLGGLLGMVSAEAKAGVRGFASPGNGGFDLGDREFDFPEGKRRDTNILIAAEIAEALAVTTYTNIINTSPFFGNIPSDDQGYLIAARQEEMSHYLLEQSVTDKPSPYTTFYYPPNMFADAQTTLNILVTLEDAFIAAYLVGVRNFSTPELRVTAARIMGIESDHRTLARVVGPDVATQDGGPINTITGIQGVAESAAPPNNNGYERTLCWNRISQAVAALTPFVDATAAAGAGFDTSKPFNFEPFTPTLPSPLGAFVSFNGC
ncbi:MAG: ferritin-like domain-containing protein [Candidatus Acidiferrales bacterium]